MGYRNRCSSRPVNQVKRVPESRGKDIRNLCPPFWSHERARPKSGSIFAACGVRSRLSDKNAARCAELSTHLSAVPISTGATAHDRSPLSFLSRRRADPGSLCSRTRALGLRTEAFVISITPAGAVNSPRCVNFRLRCREPWTVKVNISHQKSTGALSDLKDTSSNGLRDRLAPEVVIWATVIQVRSCGFEVQV